MDRRIPLACPGGDLTSAECGIPVCHVDRRGAGGQARPEESAPNAEEWVRCRELCENRVIGEGTSYTV